MSCSMCGEPNYVIADAPTDECESCADYRAYHAAMSHADRVREEQMIADHVAEAELRGF